jgi:hypothetical protein
MLKHENSIPLIDLILSEEGEKFIEPLCAALREGRRERRVVLK